MNVISALKHRLSSRPDLKRIAENIAWLFFDKILRMGVGLFVGAWVARYLGPEQFGQLNYATAFISLFGAFVALGLKGIVIRDIVRSPEETGSILSTSFFMQLFGAVAAIAVALVAIGCLRPDDDQMRALVAVVSLSLLFKTSDIIKYWYESQVQSRYTVWVENGAFLLMACVKVAMVITRAPLLAFAWVFLMEAVLVAAGLFAVYLRREKRLHSWVPGFEHARELLKDSYPLLIASISIVAYMEADKVMLGEMVGEEEVGIYGVAARISEIWYFIPMTINVSLQPLLFKLRETSYEQYKLRLQQSLNLMIWLSVPIAFGVSAGAGFIIDTLFGEMYSRSAEVLVVHVWAGVFVFLNNVTWTWYIAESKQDLVNIRMIVGLLLNIGLNYVLISDFGALGAAYATLISRSFIAYFGHLMNRETRVLFYMMSRSMLSLGFYKMRIKNSGLG